MSKLAELQMRAQTLQANRPANRSSTPPRLKPAAPVAMGGGIGGGATAAPALPAAAERRLSLPRVQPVGGQRAAQASILAAARTESAQDAETERTLEDAAARMQQMQQQQQQQQVSHGERADDP